MAVFKIDHVYFMSRENIQNNFVTLSLDNSWKSDNIKPQISGYIEYWESLQIHTKASRWWLIVKNQNTKSEN
jgi:hypothetical protein